LLEGRKNPFLRFVIGGPYGGLDCYYAALIGNDGVLRLDGRIANLTTKNIPLPISTKEIQDRLKRTAATSSRLARQASSASGRAKGGGSVLPTGGTPQEAATATALGNLSATRAAQAATAAEITQGLMERAEASAERLQVVNIYLSVLAGGLRMDYLLLRNGKIIEVGVAELAPGRDSSTSPGDDPNRDDRPGENRR
jgi:hypothetical protein